MQATQALFAPTVHASFNEEYMRLAFSRTGFEAPSPLRKWLLAVITTLCISPGLRFEASAAGPSFDCSKATQPDERAICANVDLAALELKASMEFQYVRDNVDAEQSRRLARQFLSQRHGCGGDAACIQRILSNAIQAYALLRAAKKPRAPTTERRAAALAQSPIDPQVNARLQQMVTVLKDPRQFNSNTCAGLFDMSAAKIVDACTVEIRHSPGADEYAYRAEAYRRLSLHDRAIADATRAIELNPTESGPYATRAISLVHKGEYKRALEDFSMQSKLGISLTNTFDGNYGEMIARSALMGSEENVIEAANEALKQHPDWYNIFVSRLGSFEREQNRRSHF